MYHNQVAGRNGRSIIWASEYVPWTSNACNSQLSSGKSITSLRYNIIEWLIKTFFGNCCSNFAGVVPQRLNSLLFSSRSPTRHCRSSLFPPEPFDISVFSSIPRKELWYLVALQGSSPLKKRKIWSVTCDWPIVHRSICHVYLRPQLKCSVGEVVDNMFPYWDNLGLTHGNSWSRLRPM